MIKVNQKAKENRIQELADEVIAEIKANAENGIDTTEVVLPKGVYFDTKKVINQILDDSGTDYIWLVLRPGGYLLIDLGTSWLAKIKIR